MHPHRPGRGDPPYLVLSPAFLRRLEADGDFIRRLGWLYPDGLTLEQARTLRGWCAAQGVVEIPLARTVSFAFWIFLGFFITLILKGHVLEYVF